MTDFIASHLDNAMQLAPVWGFILIFVFMTVESSFIPFPSEVVMIPAGFLAYRGLLSTHVPALDLVLAVVIGLAGSMLGAYINYGLSIWLGRPFLHKYGKYFFLKEQHLDRAEEIFRQYGDLATFVCRLLPAIRQLISIPAGLSRMDFRRFTLFTVLGAGIWNVILVLAGWYCGKATADMDYRTMIHRGMDMIHEHYIWILLGLAATAAIYLAVQHLVMKPSAPKAG